MYLTYYNLQEKPFQITTDPRFLWLGEKHQEALATLNYGLLDNKGFLLLTGDVGTGKTTLIKALVQNLGDSIYFATVVSPLLDKMEFFSHLATIFGMGGEFRTKVDFLKRFTQFLNDAHDNDKTVLLIIDEAQCLTKELLEEIRLLSNIEKENKKLLNIFFVGQNEFNDLLMEDSVRALRQRITITYHINPLSKTETLAYVKHRLKVAGTEKEIFSQKSILNIHRYSKGYPRLINIICDHALLTGYVREIKVISPAIIRECVEELSLPGERSPAVRSQISTSRNRRKKNAFGKGLLYTGLTTAMVFALYAWAVTNSPAFSNWVDNVLNRIVRPVKYPIIKKPLDSAPTSAEEILVTPSAAVSEAEAQENLSSVQNRNTIEKPVGRTDDQSSFQDGAIVAEFEEKQVDRPEVTLANAPPLAQEPKITDLGQSGKSNESQQSDLGDQALNQDQAEPVLSDDYKLIIPFDFNTNALETEAFIDLDRLSKALAQNPRFQVIIRGYTDSLGDREFNLLLSQFRANIVKSYLSGKGIEPSRIEAIALADDDPRQPNDTSAGRAANRRVEIELRSVSPSQLP